MFVIDLCWNYLNYLLCTFVFLSNIAWVPIITLEEDTRRLKVELLNNFWTALIVIVYIDKSICRLPPTDKN